VLECGVYKSIYIELEKHPLLPPIAAKQHQNRIGKPIPQIVFGGAGKKFFHQTATLLPPK
jgi:hypothetical protein